MNSSVTSQTIISSLDSVPYLNRIILACGSLLLVVFLCYLIRSILRSLNQKREAKRAEFIQENSNLLSEEARLNQSYSTSFDFSVPPEFCFTRVLNSKQQFDHFNASSFVYSCVSESPEVYRNLIAKAGGNSIVFASYQAKLDQLRENAIPPVDVPNRLFKTIEQYKACEYRLFIAGMLAPTTDISFSVQYSYTSPKGRNCYRTSSNFTQHEVALMLESYAHQTRDKDFAQRQRDLVTPSLRYDVMKRDHFRCCLCGRSSKDGVKLEVDHIIPVSKGGKTTMDNLQTLCWDCNRGKSNKC